MKKKQNKAAGELIYGLHPLIEALKAKRRKVISIYTTKPVPKGFKEVERHLPKYHIPIQYVSRDVLGRMAQTTDHQGVVAWVGPFAYRKKPFDPQKHQFLLMLDSIHDPRNLGAILRSAYCTGVTGVILNKKNAAPLNAVAIKSSAGLAEHLEIYQAPSAITAAQELESAGYQLYLAALGGTDATAVAYQKPLCLVIGNEATGIQKQLEKFGEKVMLPQRTADISYNASVAAGILLFSISNSIKAL